jgi:hypothetical protein
MRATLAVIAFGAATGLVLGTAAPGYAEPASPFPEIEHITAWYDQLEPEGFALPGQSGVRFLTPSGLNCGMWDWGSFGCAGDIPGAPPGDHHIAWFNGNRAVHHGWTAAIQFPAGQAVRTLP